MGVAIENPLAGYDDARANFGTMFEFAFPVAGAG
jgi:hypothetical protein